MKPKTLSNIDLAFTTNVNELIPAKEPGFAAYREDWNNGESWGFKLFSEWFYDGVKNLQLKPKEGIDSQVALRHIKAIMGSFAPSHEDKTAACAFLLEHWFESATWQKNSPK